MGAVKVDDKEKYFETSRTWEYDRMRAAIQSKRLAWGIATGACALAVVSVGAVAMLAPLKTVEPYVIRVDRASGETQVVTALKGSQPRTYEEAVNRYFISQYVRLREGWLNDAARENAYAVMLMSDQAEGARYLGGVESNNKNAPSNVYADKGYVSISIRTISFLSPTVAQVRFTKIITFGQNTPVAQNWNAIMTFKYATAPEREKDRNINPLGFQVVNYRTDPRRDMSNWPNISDDGDRVVIPFMPRLRKKMGIRLSPATKLVVTESGAKSRFWRGIGAVWQRLVAFSLIGAVSITIVPHPAFASQTPVPGAKDARVRNVNYDPDQVVTIVGSFRHAIEIQFGPGETVTQAALGDTVSWQIAPVGNIIFLKPRERAGGTNLIVVTNAGGSPRTYHFSLTLGTGQQMYGVRFRYPREERAMAALQAQLIQAQTAKAIETNVAQAALDHAVIEGARNMNYTVKGDSALQPTEISDNGEFTVLRYPGHADIPSIFAVDVDGTETIVPYDVREDFVVIHAVYRQLRLRRGTSVLCIYNEAPLRNDRGDRTGTVSNVVTRNVKGQ